MEIEEAAKSGLQVLTYDDFQWDEIVAKAEGDQAKMQIGLWGNIFEKLAIPVGKIGVYGTGEIGAWVERSRLLAGAFPQYQLVGEIGKTIFDEAFLTKDADELRVIREVAAKTSAVLQAAWDYIGSHRAEGDTVVKPDGSPLTIGDVKRFVRRELLDRELEDTDMIFAQGRDGGFPHSRGEASDGAQAWGSRLCSTCSHGNWAAVITMIRRGLGASVTRRTKCAIFIIR